MRLFRPPLLRQENISFFYTALGSCVDFNIPPVRSRVQNLTGFRPVPTIPRAYHFQRVHGRYGFFASAQDDGRHVLFATRTSNQPWQLNNPSRPYENYVRRSPLGNPARITVKDTLTG
jgi:hypothetical protein